MVDLWAKPELDVIKLTRAGLAKPELDVVEVAVAGLVKPELDVIKPVGASFRDYFVVGAMEKDDVV